MTVFSHSPIPRLSKMLRQSHEPLALAFGLGFLFYAAARVILFLSIPSVITQDSYGWVSPEDPFSEILENRSNRPGFLYQAILRLTGFPHSFLLTDDRSANPVDDLFLSSWLALLLSVLAYFYLGLIISRQLKAPVAKSIAYFAVLILSLNPAVWVWDRYVMSETFSASFVIFWLASLLASLQRRAFKQRDLWTVALFFALALSVRPSNLLLLGPVTIVFLLWFMSARGLGLPQTIRRSIYPLVSLGASVTWAIWQADHWAQKAGFIVDANRATALLNFPSYVAHYENASGLSVCESAVTFSEKEWAQDQHGFWGGVSEASLSERLDADCVGDWHELGESAPSLVSTVGDLRFLLEWFGDGLSNASNALIGETGLDVFALSEFQIFANNLIYSHPIAATSILILAGIFLGLHGKVGRTSLDRVAIVSVVFFANLMAVVTMAIVDGGDSFRHPIPYNQILPMLSLYLGVVLGGAFGSVHSRSSSRPARDIA